MSDIKQVIVMRSDLNMPKGKMCAQAAHASMAFLTKRLDPSCCYHPSASTVMLSEVEQRWLDESFVKIVVKVKSNFELIEVYDAACKINLVAHLVTDDGRTMFNGVRTNTCVAIGPDYADRIDYVTKDLKLL
jgi:PTH2 family peptidyl-tRNA hydrolase